VVPDPGASAGSTRFLREDATWAVPAGGSGPTDPLTTKGDIWCWSTTDDRLPVGTSGHPVIADSLTTTGLNYGDNDVRQAAAPTFAGLTISGTTVTINGAALVFPGANAAGQLTNDGAGNLSWVAAAGVAGSDTYVQFNDGGVFGADSGFTYDKVTGTLTVTAGPILGFYVRETGGGFGSASAGTGFTTLGTLIGRMPIFDASGGFLGYFPIYDDIT
jgi:hypothetical protein